MKREDEDVVGLIVGSIGFGEEVSASITVRKGRVGTANFVSETPSLSLWLNGGNSYDFNISRDLAEKLDDLSVVEQLKIARKIASKVAIAVQAEVTALELGV